MMQNLELQSLHKHQTNSHFLKNEILRNHRTGCSRATSIFPGNLPIPQNRNFTDNNFPYQSLLEGEYFQKRNMAQKRYVYPYKLMTYLRIMHILGLIHLPNHYKSDTWNKLHKLYSRTVNCFVVSNYSPVNKGFLKT